MLLFLKVGGLLKIDHQQKLDCIDLELVGNSENSHLIENEPQLNNLFFLKDYLQREIQLRVMKVQLMR